jgi:hypothetical protein
MTFQWVSFVFKAPKTQLSFIIDGYFKVIYLKKYLMNIHWKFIRVLLDMIVQEMEYEVASNI